MFTSRAEYRLLLRQDNADLRLMEKGFHLGLINQEQFEQLLQKKTAIEREIKRFKSTPVKPEIINPILKKLGGSTIKEPVTLSQLLKRPEVRYEDIANVSPPKNRLSYDITSQVEIQIKYEGYIQRQAELVERFKRLEDKKIPEDFVYRGIPGLSREIIEKLEEVRPLNLGQASRIPGITPAAISLLMVAVERHRRQRIKV
jgi:tRNA uridine 5-carboxymethylaminomethyl modification enzyme